MSYILFFVICMGVICYVIYKQPQSQPIQTDRNANSSYEIKGAYEVLSDYDKSELYFKHRMNMVLKNHYPDLLSWHTCRNGVSILDQAIEVTVVLPGEEEKRLWVRADELTGSFQIKKCEFNEEDVCKERLPDDMRKFFEKYSGLIDRKIRFAIENGLNYAYFEFRDDESEEFRKKICDRLEATKEGVMCQLNGKKMSINVQNMLDI